MTPPHLKCSPYRIVIMKSFSDAADPPKILVVAERRSEHSPSEKSSSYTHWGSFSIFVLLEVCIQLTLLHLYCFSPIKLNPPLHETVQTEPSISDLVQLTVPFSGVGNLLQYPDAQTGTTGRGSLRFLEHSKRRGAPTTRKNSAGQEASQFNFPKTGLGSHLISVRLSGRSSPGHPAFFSNQRDS